MDKIIKPIVLISLVGGFIFLAKYTKPYFDKFRVNKLEKKAIEDMQNIILYGV
jgi:hypothetical protein